MVVVGAPSSTVGEASEELEGSTMSSEAAVLPRDTPSPPNATYLGGGGGVYCSLRLSSRPTARFSVPFRSSSGTKPAARVDKNRRFAGSIDGRVRRGHY